MGSFDDKCVIVTGGAAGFGEAVCRKFAAAGASVVVADLNLEGAQTVADSLPSAIAIKVDVAEEEDNKAMVQAAVDAYGKIDVVCCNAGVPHRGSYMVKMDVEAFDAMWAINVRSIFLAAKHASPQPAAPPVTMTHLS